MSLARGLPPNPANFELGERGFYISIPRASMTDGLGAAVVDTFCPPTVFLIPLKMDALLMGAPINVNASRARGE